LKKYNPKSLMVNYDRSGWTKDSKCPERNYTQAEIYGALSYPTSLFTLSHVWLLGGGSVGRWGPRRRPMEPEKIPLVNFKSNLPNRIKLESRSYPPNYDSGLFVHPITL
jgi:hypothetical protein